MKTFSIKQVRLAVACALALGTLSASAQSLAPINDRELVGASGNQVWMNSFGECWHSAFGPGPTPNVQCGPQPLAAYVAPVQERKIIVAAVVPAPVYERVTFDTNVMFDSGKSTLRPESRQSLDKFIGQTKDLVDPSSMMAVGYADRQGSDNRNQILSEERVAAVKGYVVSQGVQWNTVGTSGAGESRPTTYLHECDKATNAKTVACLQPDRHVFIQLSGNRVKQ